MAVMFRTINNSAARGLTTMHHEEISVGNMYFQNSPSLAEQTLSKYHHDPISKEPPLSRNLHIETRIHPVTGLQHPFDKARNFLSRFPLGFRGCFNCGKTDHRNTRDCPLAQQGNFDKIRFL